MLYAHPAVTDCALIGIPHRTLGRGAGGGGPSRARACRRARPSCRPGCASGSPAFKVPVAIRFVDETLPRNANGKILKKELKALFAERVAA